MMGKGELANIIKKNNGAGRNTGHGGDNQGADDQNDIEEGDHGLNEEMLLEMCKFSNMSTSNSVKKASGNGTIVRVGGASGKQSETKNVVEDIDVDLDGDVGTDGRPRVREIIELPPQYENIDLNDPNAEILFQGELVKYKAGYTPTFISRWI
jgi:hypothetical protein